MDKYGSHIIDRCWTFADLKMKETIADELLMKEEELKESHYGHFVVRNCNLDHYKRKKEEWKQKEQAVEKKKNMFADITIKEEGNHVKVPPKLEATTDIEDMMRARDAHTIDPIMLSLGYMKGTNDRSKNLKEKRENPKSKKKSHLKRDRQERDEEEDLMPDTSVRKLS